MCVSVGLTGAIFSRFGERLMHRFMWTCTVMRILFAAFREALEQRLGAVQDSDMMELLMSVVKLRVSVTPPSAAAGVLCAAKVVTQNDTI